MITLTQESFKQIVPLLQEQHNYVNVYGMLKDKYKLNEQELETFAEVMMKSNAASWLAPEGNDYHPFTEANDEQRQRISTVLSERRELVEKKLSSRQDLLASLFVVPREEDIFWWEDDQGEMHVKLAAWGFKTLNKNHQVDIIGLIFKSYPPKKQVGITLHIDYSDGKPAAGEVFSLTMFNNTKSITTNDDGDFYCGKMFPGQKLTVADDHGQSFEFEVDADESVYNARFNYLTSFVVTVFDDQDTLQSGYPLLIDGQQYVTDEQGLVEVDDLLLTPDKSITVQGSGNSTPATFTLQRDKGSNQFEYRINAPRTGYTLTVKNQLGKVKADYGLTIDGKPFTTDENGQVTVSEMVYHEGLEIAVKGHRSTDETVMFALNADNGTNQFVYNVTDETPPSRKSNITLTFLDRNKRPLADVDIQVTTKAGKRLTAVTDEKGSVTFPREEFESREKPKIEFVLTKEYQQHHPGKFK